MILPLPRTGPSSCCRLQFTTKVRLSSSSRAATPMAPSDSGSPISPSPRNAQTCCWLVSLMPRLLHVAVEPGLVDRVEGGEAHRHGRELPEVRHQPRVRVRREALADAVLHLLAEPGQLRLVEPALEERPGVDAGGGVALDVDLVAAALVVLAAEEVVEADLVERGRGLVRRDVTADLEALAVRGRDGDGGVPAQEGADPALDVLVAGEPRLALGRDRVDVVGAAQRGHADVLLAGPLEQAQHHVARAAAAPVVDHRVERLEPFLGLVGVDVRELRGQPLVDDLGASDGAGRGGAGLRLGFLLGGLLRGQLGRLLLRTCCHDSSALVLGVHCVVGAGPGRGVVPRSSCHARGEQEIYRSVGCAAMPRVVRHGAHPVLSPPRRSTASSPTPTTRWTGSSRSSARTRVAGSRGSSTASARWRWAPTTYEWVLDHEHLLEHPRRWQEFYADRPCWVFSAPRPRRRSPAPTSGSCRATSPPVHARDGRGGRRPQRLARRRWRPGRPVPRRRAARPGPGQRRAGDARVPAPRCCRAASRACG